MQWGTVGASPSCTRSPLSQSVGRFILAGGPKLRPPAIHYSWRLLWSSAALLDRQPSTTQPSLSLPLLLMRKLGSLLRSSCSSCRAAAGPTRMPSLPPFLRVRVICLISDSLSASLLQGVGKGIEGQPLDSSHHRMHACLCRTTGRALRNLADPTSTWAETQASSPIGVQQHVHQPSQGAVVGGKRVRDARVDCTQGADRQERDALQR